MNRPGGQILYATVLLLASVIVFGVASPGSLSDEPSSYVYEVRIETDRDVIRMGESFTATVYLYNQGDGDILLEPIRQFTFSGNSAFDPEPVSCVVNADYPGGTKIRIGAHDKAAFLQQVFTPEYPGPFRVTCLGAQATVNVTGARQVPISSAEVGLEVGFNVTGRLIEALLILVNDNPYPVKVPVFFKLPIYREFYGFSNNSTAYIRWAISFFNVEADSTKVVFREDMGIYSEKYQYVCVFYVEGRVAKGVYPPP
jgi:hypothetical protein